jgi:methionyl-tRNA synthetase
VRRSKNGRYVKEKSGNRTGKITSVGSFYIKDNIVFHCIIFPGDKKAEGSYILPDNVPANEFLNLEGNKLSTSKKWAVWLHEYLVDFPGQQDVLRYALTSNATGN